MDYESIAVLIDFLLSEKDPYNHHGINVANMSSKFAEHLNLPTNERTHLYFSARLHDIGKVLLTDDLLNLSRRLTTNEYERVKAHAPLGYRILYGVRALPEIILAVSQHHEHYDGSGYPRGLAGNEIHKFARIICICDVWDSMTSDRAYRKAMPRSEALEEMYRTSNWFDPELFAIFLKIIEEPNDKE